MRGEGERRSGCGVRGEGERRSGCGVRGEGEGGSGCGVRGEGERGRRREVREGNSRGFRCSRKRRSGESPARWGGSRRAPRREGSREEERRGE